MPEIDTSIYKGAAPQSPLSTLSPMVDTANKIQQNRILQQQQIQQQLGIDKSKLELAMQQIGILRNVTTSLLSDPDAGKKDMTKRIQEETNRFVAMRMYTPEQAVQFLKGIPRDPKEQYKYLINMHTQALDAQQRMGAFFGAPEVRDVGGAQITTQTPGLPGLPTRTRAEVPTTLPATTQVPGPNQQMQFTGQPGIPQVRQGPAEVIPGSAPASPPVKPTPSAFPLGTGEAAQKGGAALAEARDAAGTYARRINPLQSALRIVSGMKETEIGPTSEQWNNIKSSIQTLGLGKVGGIDPEKIKNHNELKKYLTDYASQRAQGLGPRTNDGLATAVAANPNMTMDKLSVQDLLKVNLGLEAMQQTGVLQFEDDLEKGKTTPGQFGTWMARWSTQQDPRAYVINFMSPEAQEKMWKSLTPQQKEKFRKTRETAESLGTVE